LDCVLGGGWALGRVANIVGDKSTGKTLQAIEACANFAVKYPKGKIFYREAEAAFDEGYAEELGLPVKRVDFGPDGLETNWDTIEDIFADIEKQVDVCEKAGVPGLYIVDSLDALTSKAELGRDAEKGTFGLEKQKLLGRLFRQMIRKIKSSKMSVIIISQTRDKIGVMFGEKHTRSGGKSLDFYATHVLWLHHIETINKTSGGVKRAVGIRIKAKCKKNKISLPFRECEYDITFGYGVEDIDASIDYLVEHKALDKIGIPEKELDAFARKADGDAPTREQLKGAVIATWAEIEKRFAPGRKKYA
jgi:recombination protein RecA